MSEYELTVRSEFAAAHRIRFPNGALEPLHGHNWRVDVVVRAAGLDENGIAADFELLQRQLETAIRELRHANLNDLPALADPGPTTELIAKYIHDRLIPGLPEGVQVREVRVWETDRCAAAYIPSGEVGQ